MPRATWSPEDTAWLQSNPGSQLPPLAYPYVPAHARWAPLRRQSDRARVDPWDEKEFKAQFPCGQSTRTTRALAWLRVEFSP